MFPLLSNTEGQGQKSLRSKIICLAAQKTRQYLSKPEYCAETQKGFGSDDPWKNDEEKCCYTTLHHEEKLLQSSLLVAAFAEKR